jgi:hypothetical protein
VRWLNRTPDYRLWQQARKKIEALWGAITAFSGVDSCKTETRPICKRLENLLSVPAQREAQGVCGCLRTRNAQERDGANAC